MNLRFPYSFCWHINRGGGTTLNTGRTVWIFTVCMTEFLEQFSRKVQLLVHRSYRMDFYSSYNRFVAQKLRRIAMCVF
jgi:hypothetical protein